MMLTAYLLTLIFIQTGLCVKPVVQPCDENIFDSNVQLCLSAFDNSMAKRSYNDSCPWPTVKLDYYNLTHCVDNLAKRSWCKGHKFLVHDIFLEIHKKYFFLCGQVSDPPLTTLIFLIAPCIIATFFLPPLCLKLTNWDTVKY